MDLMKNKKAVAAGVVIVCVLIIVFFAVSGNNKTTETANEVVKEKKVDNTAEEKAEKAVTHEEEANLDDLVNAAASKTVTKKKYEVPEKNVEVKKDKKLSKTDNLKKADKSLSKTVAAAKTEKTIKAPVNNYRNFKSPYINFRFDANDWGYSFGKDMNISNSIVFPERKPFIIIEFYEKPNYRNHVILYVAEADKMSDFAESKGNEPIDYVKYLFNEYSCKNLSIKETNKNKIVTGNISAKNSTKPEKYYIISRYDLLFILISNNQNEKEKELVNNIINSI